MASLSVPFEGKQPIQKWLFSQPPTESVRGKMFRYDIHLSFEKRQKPFNFEGKSQTKKRATVGGGVDSRDSGL
jgi:hypothetical protein